MASDDHELALPPPEGRARELWLQHAAGFILFRDIRDYARGEIDPNLGNEAREAAEKAIDDALYGLMTVVDGVAGELSGHGHAVRLSLTARLVDDAGAPLTTLDLAEGDGMCMGFHGWREDDFGRDPVVI